MIEQFGKPFQPQKPCQRPQLDLGILDQRLVVHRAGLERQELGGPGPKLHLFVIEERSILKRQEVRPEPRRLEARHEAAQNHVARVPLHENDGSGGKQAMDERQAAHGERVFVDQQARARIRRVFFGFREIEAAKLFGLGRSQMWEPREPADPLSDEGEHRFLLDHGRAGMAHEQGIEQRRPGARETDEEGGLTIGRRIDRAPAGDPLRGELVSVVRQRLPRLSRRTMGQAAGSSILQIHLDEGLEGALGVAQTIEALADDLRARAGVD